ncbi:hypothetical protein NE237_011799 [Protea cynaroides]|uniref:Dynamin N-terminal domain-containing protein n=1 Tax=Protea cynaroides TaxID=273540 RepID=A0A9Q0GXV9_9MAGN|nr:hypothetical protein NE237_011799 [Protea cynaroides]
MMTMESLIGLVNRIQRACTVLGDNGGDNDTFLSMWEALPSVAVVGGQVYQLISLLFSTYSCCDLYFCLYVLVLFLIWWSEQSSGKSSVLESIVGHDFLPRDSDRN